jgi:hypothetical protein
VFEPLRPCLPGVALVLPVGKPAVEALLPLFQPLISLRPRDVPLAEEVALSTPLCQLSAFAPAPPMAARAAGPQVGEQLNSILGEILKPVQETTGSKFLPQENWTLLTICEGADTQTPVRRGGRQSRGSTPALSSANRSFHHESGIFNSAAIDDSVVQDSPELHDIPEERESIASDPFPMSIDTRLEREEAAMRQELQTLARRRLVEARVADGQATISDIWNTRELSRAWFSTFLQWIWSFNKL